mmetsp:Transcript_166236/g.533759  ORF Transcript_166236/g.533759 Transcript_166236/m.533759 type:complete len:317 (-) Transcript_166236:814-1764(-)
MSGFQAQGPQRRLRPSGRKLVRRPDLPTTGASHSPAVPRAVPEADVALASALHCDGQTCPYGGWRAQELCQVRGLQGHACERRTLHTAFVEVGQLLHYHSGQQLQVEAGVGASCAAAALLHGGLAAPLSAETGHPGIVVVNVGTVQPEVHDGIHTRHCQRRLSDVGRQGNSPLALPSRLQGILVRFQLQGGMYQIDGWAHASLPRFFLQDFFDLAHLIQAGQEDQRTAVTVLFKVDFAQPAQQRGSEGRHLLAMLRQLIRLPLVRQVLCLGGPELQEVRLLARTLEDAREAAPDVLPEQIRDFEGRRAGEADLSGL